MTRSATLSVFARLALASAFLSSVADRFGLWGQPGEPRVSWGDFAHFLAYSRKVNAFMPELLQRPLAWTATALELACGLLLVAGLWVRVTSLASGTLLLLFAVAMTLSTGLKSALAYSVYTAAASAFLLASAKTPEFSLDAWLSRSTKAPSGGVARGSGGSSNVEEMTS